MKAPDKIYVSHLIYDTWQYTTPNPDDETEVEYIRKDALMEYLDKELDRLYELLPDASNENPSQMELRYLGQYMQTEKLIDELNEL